MLQQGKGAEMGASFGSGSSQTIFGAVGSGNLFSRLTAILVAVFLSPALAWRLCPNTNQKLTITFSASD